MTVDKRISYEEQGGVKNYKPSEMVTVPKRAKSSPKHPETELAYITKEEKDLLVKKDIHNSLKGKPNKGPGGIISLNGDFEDMVRGITGADISAAERGEGPRGAMTDTEAQDFRSAAIAAGAGQRVNPGFFDDRNTVSRAELLKAKAFNPAAFKATRGGGIMDFFTGGGFLGNIIRGLGQKFGLGKRYNAPYDRPQFAPGFATNLPQMQYDIYNEFVDTEKLTDPNAQYLYDRDKILSGMNTFVAPPGQMNYTGINSLNLETPQQQAEDDFLKGAMADALTFPTDDGSGISLMKRSILRNAGYNDSQIKEAQEDGYLDQLIRDIEGPIGGSAFG